MSGDMNGKFTDNDQFGFNKRLKGLAQKEVSLKILVIGDFGVGKTAIVRRYTEGKFSSNYKITIGADFAIKSINWNKDTRINLQVWDIAGHERFGYMTRVYYKYAVAAAVVFDVSRIATFQAVDKWITDLREKVSLPDGQPIPVVLLANKGDITNSHIPSEAISRLCNEFGIQKWYITSAKDNSNIDDAFHTLVQHAMDNEMLYSTNDDTDAIKLGFNDKKVGNKEKSLCCA